MASSTNTGKYIELPCRESNPGLPRDRRGYSPLYYRGLSIWNRLWVYKFFMILKYCNRWRPVLIQENKLNSPAGNRTLVSRVTRGDTQHYTTEDCLSGTGCEFINSWWFWSNGIDGVLYLYRKINWTPRQGVEPWSPAWQAGILTTILPMIVYVEQVVSL